MSDPLEYVRELLAKGHTMEAAAYVKRIEPMPLSESVARGLLSMLASAILNPVKRGKGDKIDVDPFVTAGIEYRIRDEVRELCDLGLSQESAFEEVGRRRNKSAKTVERIFRK